MAKRSWCEPSPPPAPCNIPGIPPASLSDQHEQYMWAPLVPPSPSGESFYPKPCFNLFENSTTDLHTLFGYDPNRDPNLYRSRWPLPKYILPGCRSSKKFYGRVGDPNCSDNHNHKIVFNDDGFTVDGELRELNDPKNLPFLDSIDKCECPAEFNKPGLHAIEVHGELSLPGDAAEQVKAKSRFVATDPPMTTNSYGGGDLDYLRNISF